MATILVTGGTGTVGRRVVDRLLEAGHHVRVASRRPRPAAPVPHDWAAVDYRSGEGVDAAVAGVHTIVHCAWSLGGRVDRTLLSAARRAGTAHLVYISIVGVDRIPFRYYRTKLESERWIARSGMGWTVLRTTQFHDLVFTGLSAAHRLPLVPLPASVLIQPMDAREVGERLALLATSAPAGRVADMGGPQVRGIDDLARAYQRVTGRRRPLLPVWLSGRVFTGYRAGHHLTPDRAVGRVTFEQFLARRLGSGAAARPAEAGGRR